MKKGKLMTTSLIFIVMLCSTLSCQDNEQVKPEANVVGRPEASVIVRPIWDERIKAEILSMVNVKDDNQNNVDRTAICCGGLPPGYDYNNMQEVIISGTNWVTYVAYSLTTNTSTRKKSVGLYYKNGEFENFLYVDHAKNTVNGRLRHTVRYHIPENYPNHWVQGMVYADDGSVTVINSTGEKSSCGQTTMIA